MEQRRRLIKLAAVPALTAIVAFLALGVSRAAMQEAPPSWAKPCGFGASSSVEPGELALGSTAKVTLVLTSTCPAYDLPVDIVFVVDRSNSMTKGSGTGPVVPGPGETPGIVPTGALVGPKPTQKQPPATKPPDPGPPTNAPPSIGLVTMRVRGLAQGRIVPTRSLPTPGAGTPTMPSRPTPGGIVPTGGLADPTRSLIRRDTVEPAGNEDLIREVQEAIRDFLDYNETAINEGRMRVAMVSFNERARADVEFNRGTNSAARVRSALGRLRGEGNTRIDLGLSAAQRTLFGVSYRGRTDLDYRKVSILFSDGKADVRTTARLRQRDDITYMSVAVGRSADLHTMRQLASESEFFFDIRDRQQLAERVNGLKRKTRTVSLSKVVVADKLMANMAVVPGSAIPPPSRVQVDGTLEWDFMNPTGPVTVTYDVRPLAIGRLPVSELAVARWQDTEARTGTVPFPAVELDVVQGLAERALPKLWARLEQR